MCALFVQKQIDVVVLNANPGWYSSRRLRQFVKGLRQSMRFIGLGQGHGKLIAQCSVNNLVGAAVSS
jgi:hypothetical protein